MHMADALLSPSVGATMWAATAATVGYCAKKVREEPDDGKVPLMGVLGAFIFAAQMINFTIPATGSSGHLGGGMILAVLLGPYAAFLTITSVLTVQALFFADGGLLALGCNIFNLGVFPCFVAYPFVYQPVLGVRPNPRRLTAACLVSAVVGLQLGAFAVVLETVLSGVSELPFRSFVWLMQPIHLAIGIVEGLVTAAVVRFIWKAQPALLERAAGHRPLGRRAWKKVVGGLAVAALVTGGALSWFASNNPDGLEWSMSKVSGRGELESKDKVHEALAALQRKLAFLPAYGFKTAKPAARGAAQATSGGSPGWPAVDAGTSVSGLVGGGITLAVAALLGLLLKRRRPVA